MEGTPGLVLPISQSGTAILTPYPPPPPSPGKEPTDKPEATNSSYRISIFVFPLRDPSGFLSPFRPSSSPVSITISNNNDDDYCCADSSIQPPGAVLPNKPASRLRALSSTPHSSDFSEFDWTDSGETFYRGSGQPVAVHRLNKGQATESISSEEAYVGRRTYSHNMTLVIIRSTNGADSEKHKKARFRHGSGHFSDSHTIQPVWWVIYGSDSFEKDCANGLNRADKLKSVILSKIIVPETFIIFKP